MKKLIFILALSSSSFMAHAEEIPGEFILQSFKSTCTSIGNWTELALNDSRALMQTLEIVSQYQVLSLNLEGLNLSSQV